MLAIRTTLPHFSDSAAMKAANSWALSGIGTVRTGGNTMAIDTGAIEIAVALTAACRTAVANLGIRTRVAETCG